MASYARAGVLLHVSLIAVAAANAISAAEPAWPGKPLRFIVPFPAGSSTDSAARLLAPKLGVALGQPVIVDNRGGASGNIGVETAARAVPDGYTLVLGTASTHAVAVSVNTRLAYDPVADFSPVSLLVSSPYVVIVHPSVAASSALELIALAKARPGQNKLRVGGRCQPRASGRRIVCDPRRSETQSRSI